jgi:hypothetical protein
VSAPKPLSLTSAAKALRHAEAAAARATRHIARGAPLERITHDLHTLARWAGIARTIVRHYPLPKTED